MSLPTQLTKMADVVKVEAERDGRLRCWSPHDIYGYQVWLTPEEMLALAEEIRALALAGKETP